MRQNPNPNNPGWKGLGLTQTQTTFRSVFFLEGGRGPEQQQPREGVKAPTPGRGGVPTNNNNPFNIQGSGLGELKQPGLDGLFGFGLNSNFSAWVSKFKLNPTPNFEFGFPRTQTQTTHGPVVWVWFGPNPNPNNRGKSFEFEFRGT